MRWLAPLALLLLHGCGALLYPVETSSTETLHLPGVALHHYPPKTPARPTPVVLAHGVTSNRFNFDLGGPDALPRRLAELGFDTWVLELHGAGEAEGPGLFGDWDYGFDDYVLKDMPVAVEAIAARGRSGQVHWIGHSMGGMVMYGYLQRVAQAKARVRSLTALGSPAMIFDHNPNIEDGKALFRFGAALSNRLPTGLLAKTFAPWALAPDPRLDVFWNPENMDPVTARRLAANAVNDVGAPVIGQFVDGHTLGAFMCRQQQWNYTEEMRRIEVPVFFIAGAVDQLASPVSLIAGYERVKGPKRLEILSRANGYRHDYGHLDLVVGKHVAEEVHPLLIGWLLAHD